MSNKLNYSEHSKGFAIEVARWNKTMKIISILREYGRGEKCSSLLDIGTGNGEIASPLGEFYNVVSMDVVDQRDVHDGYTFVQLDGEELPFADKSFDVVVTNHIIEHGQCGFAFI